MANFRLPMEIFADAMANERLHHTQLLRFDKLLNDSADLTEWHLRTAHAYAMVQRLFGHLDQVAANVVHVADQKRFRAVAVEAIQIDGDVHVDDVAGCQRPIVGDAVANDVVHGRAHRLRETGVVQRRRVGVRGDCLLVHESIDVVGCYAGLANRNCKSYNNVRRNALWASANRNEPARSWSISRECWRRADNCRASF